VGWEEEVPAILRSDMRNLTDTAQGDAGPMNLQQRVIQSGLDSIQGPDAPSIVMLFMASAIFAEDCSVSSIAVLFQWCCQCCISGAASAVSVVLLVLFQWCC